MEAVARLHKNAVETVKISSLVKAAWTNPVGNWGPHFTRLNTLWIHTLCHNHPLGSLNYARVEKVREILFIREVILRIRLSSREALTVMEPIPDLHGSSNPNYKLTFTISGEKKLKRCHKNKVEVE